MHASSHVLPTYADKYLHDNVGEDYCLGLCSVFFHFDLIFMSSDLYPFLCIHLCCTGKEQDTSVQCTVNARAYLLFKSPMQQGLS